MTNIKNLKKLNPWLSLGTWRVSQSVRDEAGLLLFSVPSPADIPRSPGKVAAIITPAVSAAHLSSDPAKKESGSLGRGHMTARHSLDP